MDILVVLMTIASIRRQDAFGERFVYMIGIVYEILLSKTYLIS
jgi:hypothetical protein